ncbi:MAG: twitching motility protein PilT [Sporichthyaceae bacterium]
MTTVYDAGALIAGERNRRDFWADHLVRLQFGELPAVPAPVVGQVSRSGRQVQLRRLLRGCDVVATTEDDAHAAGLLLAATRSDDVIDAVVAVVAAERDADFVVTSDRSDIEPLLAAARARARVVDV